MPFASSYRPGSKGAKKLTNKMLAFIDEYMIDLNGTEAVKRSPYITNDPNKIARRLLAHPGIREEVDRRMSERQIKTEIKADYIVNKLVEIIEGDEKTPDRLRAIELAGKTIGIFKDRQEISGPDGEAIRTEQTIKENASDFTSRISSLAKRNGTDNVVEFPDGSGKGST